MLSPLAEKAIEDAQQHGKAILKFISANDAGLTGSHQAGFYLPRAAWQLYAPFGPERGRKQKSQVRIVWQGGALETQSVVTWYGQKTRAEYRLTCFGKGFPYLNDDTVGDLLVLIPQDLNNFLAYVIDLPEDVDDVQAALGAEAIGSWAIHDAAAAAPELSEDDCIDQRFRTFAEGLLAFPTGAAFSVCARDAMLDCMRDLAKKSSDYRLMTLMQGEYRLFKMVERQICLPEVRRLFRDIDDFIKTAATLMNRRKSRAGRSFENHVRYVLDDAGIPFDSTPDIEGEPDIVIPGKAEYDDPKYPADRLFMVGVKTTCKDRWRQVTREAPRITIKHLLTMQEGVSAAQLTQMKRANVELVVPRSLHRRYPKVEGVGPLDVATFIRTVRRTLG